ncbi:MAG: hypothetical protein KKC01_12060 [Gammaproteobacteria bacterium]|nr:hypothetical protein [Gammaproteobacteria bacterium]
MVVLLSGRVEFVLRRESGDESIILEDPGSFVIVPRNTWHTARVAQATSVLFVTPGEGTENAVSPPIGT